MSDKRRSKLPIFTHTEFLGVDIGYSQRDEGRVRIRAYGVDAGVPLFVKRELSHWARRNLFGVDDSE